MKTLEDHMLPDEAHDPRKIWSSEKLYDTLSKRSTRLDNESALAKEDKHFFLQVSRSMEAIEKELRSMTADEAAPLRDKLASLKEKMSGLQYLYEEWRKQVDIGKEENMALTTALKELQDASKQICALEAASHQHSPLQPVFR